MLGHVHVPCLPGHHRCPAEGPRHGLSVAQLHHGRHHVRGAAAGICHVRAHARQRLRAQQQRNSCCAAAARCGARTWAPAVLGCFSTLKQCAPLSHSLWVLLHTRTAPCPGCACQGPSAIFLACHGFHAKSAPHRQAACICPRQMPATIQIPCIGQQCRLTAM